MEKERTKLFSRLFKHINEVLALIVSIVTSLVFILTKINAIPVDKKTLLGFVDTMNLGVLFVFLLTIGNSLISKDDEGLKNYSKRLNLKMDEDKIARVNILVSQLVICIRWFIIILGIFYVFQFLIDFVNDFDYDVIKTEITSNTSILKLISKGKDDSASYLVYEIGTNITNLFSAAFLIVAFQVLFFKTISPDNKTWWLIKKGRAYIPVSIAFMVTLISAAFYICGINDLSLADISISTSLSIGIYNGIAMLLLFSRFITMEYFFINSRPTTWEVNFYLYGTIIILPLYVVVQPLYGIINAVELKSLEVFKALIFLFCFFGKLIFLLFTYTMVRKKWIHYFLYATLIQTEITNENN